MDGMRQNPPFFNRWMALGDGFFYAALLASLIIHLSVIMYFSSERIKISRKLTQPIEVTFQRVPPKKVVQEMERSKPIEAVKEKKAPQKVEVLTKDSKDL